MMTLRKFAAGPLTVPASTAWYLADLGEAKGRQALYTRQSPQRLKVLLENALIESAVSSNRIEGVTLDKARIRPVILGRALLRDLQRARRVICLGRGPGARWRRKGNVPERGQ